MLYISIYFGFNSASIWCVTGKFCPMKILDFTMVDSNDIMHAICYTVFKTGCDVHCILVNTDGSTLVSDWCTISRSVQEALQ